MVPTLKVDKYRLMELRDLADIKSDRELAQKLHIHPNTLSRIKNGARIDGNFIAAAHVVLGAPLDDRLYKLEPPAAA